MKAFMSYQMDDRLAAASVSKLLGEFEISSFMAHENIEVSNEWRLEILRQIGLADIFVAIISKNYFNSIWCKQESGIAAFRDMTIIPLSIDGTIPQGFMAHIQSTKINPADISIQNILPGLAKHNISFVIDKLITKIANSGSYRRAESNFELLLPYQDKLSEEQGVRLLNESLDNRQVCDASLCGGKYLPPILEKFGNKMDKKRRAELAGITEHYKKYV